MEINRANAAKQFAQAITTNDEAVISEAWQCCMNEIAERVIEEHAALQGVTDAQILDSRGIRQLTGPETKWYERLINAAHGTKQQFIDLFANEGDDEWMPETIIEDVFRHLEDDHPMLKRIKFNYVGYSSKWIIDDSSVQKGAWGKIDAKITEEITGGLKVLDLEQKKYTAFVIIPLAIIDLGPQWIDSYVRRVLIEAISTGLEDAIVNGTGVDMPCGLTRDPNSAFDQSKGYAAKTAVKVKSFAPADYGPLVAKLAKTEKGKPRKFAKVELLCNMTDYLTKVMPATTAMKGDGTGYARDLFPFATDVIVTNALADGTALLCLLPEYNLAAGIRKNNTTEFDDSIGFLDHTRAYRNVNYYDGRAYDNTCAIVLDISELDPHYVTVMVANAADFGGAPAAKEAAEEIPEA